MGAMSLHLVGAAVNRSLSLRRKDEPDVRLINDDPLSGGTLRLPRKTLYAAEPEPISPEVAVLQRLTRGAATTWSSHHLGDLHDLILEPRLEARRRG